MFYDFKIQISELIGNDFSPNPDLAWSKTGPYYWNGKYNIVSTTTGGTLNTDFAAIDLTPYGNLSANGDAVNVSFDRIEPEELSKSEWSGGVVAWWRFYDASDNILAEIRTINNGAAYHPAAFLIVYGDQTVIGKVIHPFAAKNSKFSVECSTDSNFISIAIFHDGNVDQSQYAPHLIDVIRAPNTVSGKGPARKIGMRPIQSSESYYRTGCRDNHFYMNVILGKNSFSECCALQYPLRLDGAINETVMIYEGETFSDNFDIGYRQIAAPVAGFYPVTILHSFAAEYTFASPFIESPVDMHYEFVISGDTVQTQSYNFDEDSVTYMVRTTPDPLHQIEIGTGTHTVMIEAV